MTLLTESAERLGECHADGVRLRMQALRVFSPTYLCARAWNLTHAGLSYLYE
jgi:hypothetical protein